MQSAERLRPVGFYDIEGRSLIGELHLRDTIAEDPQPDEARILAYLA
jgi:hypothetical protein